MISRALKRPPSTPLSDRAPERVLDANETDLAVGLRDLLGDDRVFTSATDLIRFSADASPYRLVPQAVVRPHDTGELVALVRFARQTGHSLTFRAGGTSLNGQAQGDDILVDVREHFRTAKVLDDGARLRCDPGVVLARANALLARHGRMLGPDPASAAAATVGGVLANNASGMTCGIITNAFRTIESVVVVLPSGTVLDTGAPEADARFHGLEPELYAGLEAIRDDLRADQELVDFVKRRYLIKNTSGYRLDAFLEADTPAAILTLLLVGSEGTLGAVVDTVWRTVDAGPLRSTGFLRFPDVQQAAAVVAPLNALGAQSVELMDAASLKSLRTAKNVPAWVAALPDDADDAVILTERRTSDPAELDKFERQVAELAAHRVLATSADPNEPLLTRDPAQAAVFWAMRKGMLASVGAARPAGTALITEDVVVPPERLPEAVTDLQQLLTRHNFTGAVNGHASAGNMHFYIYLDATSEQKIGDYRAFMTELVDLIVDRYDGCLKGEHGTGRNMAPFIEREWGATAMEFMRRIKRTIDPDNLFGPGVLINDDPEVAFTNLKSMPLVHEHLDPCIECGFCEPVCPSRHVTTTPRQRIVLQRELARQGHTGPVTERLVTEYAYNAVETCAGDSSCAIACPVHIDTGTVMKELRRDGFPAPAQRVGLAAAKGWGVAERGARVALKAAALVRPVLGDRGLAAITGVARRVAGDDLVPRWLPEVPGAAAAVPQTRPGGEAVFFPACINRIFGTATGDGLGVSQAFVALAERAGHPVTIPDDVTGLCCGTVWHSKGLESGNTEMAGLIMEAMWRWSRGGELPIVVDASSCTLGVSHEILGYLDTDQLARHKCLKIVDVLTYTREVLLPGLPDLPEDADQAALAVVHPTCSMHTLGLTGDLTALAGVVAQQVFEPLTATCCAFAGDRGMLHPELTAGATMEEREQVEARLAAGVTDRDGRPGQAVFVSGNRTCELGMQHATGEPYESVIVTLERLTRPN